MPTSGYKHREAVLLFSWNPYFSSLWLRFVQPRRNFCAVRKTDALQLSP